MSEQEKVSLDNLRVEIDRIDDQLLELLGERSGIVEMVGKIKNVGGKKESIIRPGREALMIRRLANKGGGAFSKAAIAHLWRLIIASSIMIEEDTKIAALSPQHNTECFWLAREYFGAFTPITKHASTTDVIKDVEEGDATVGVIPIWDDNAPKPWWMRLTENEDAPYVFAKLPFIKQAPSQKSPLVGIGYITPEATGDDQSLWVVMVPETVSFEEMEPALKQSLGTDLVVVDHFRQVANPTMHCYLLQLYGFVGKDDKKIDKFVSNLKEIVYKDAPIFTHYLGSFASPISI